MCGWGWNYRLVCGGGAGSSYILKKEEGEKGTPKKECCGRRGDLSKERESREIVGVASKNVLPLLFPKHTRSLPVSSQLHVMWLYV